MWCISVKKASRISEDQHSEQNVLFNSTLYDCYYRLLNGSTQVNSTEVNTMPVPPLNDIEAMGKELLRVKDMSEESCDRILRSYI